MMLLEGLLLPLTTPFYPDGRLNLRKLEYNVARYSKTPASGLIAGGDFGEPTMLSDEETRLAMKSTRDAASAEKVLIAGVSRASVIGTLDLIHHAAELDYDAVLVKQPTMLRIRAREGLVKQMLTYFQAVADRSSLPIIVCSAQPEESLPVEIVVELAGNPQIIGLVDSAVGVERMKKLKLLTSSIKRDVTVTSTFSAVTGRMQTGSDRPVGDGMISADALTDGGSALAVLPSKPRVRTRTKVVGFQILVNQTATMLDGLLAGAVGAMPAFAASVPQACYEVLAAWKDGDQGLAREKQIRLLEAAMKLEVELGVAGIKYGCDLNGYYGGGPRLPLLPLTGKERSEIEAVMQGLRV